MALILIFGLFFISKGFQAITKFGMLPNILSSKFPLLSILSHIRENVVNKAWSKVACNPNRFSDTGFQGI